MYTYARSSRGDPIDWQLALTRRWRSSSRSAGRRRRPPRRLGCAPPRISTSPSFPDAYHRPRALRFWPPKTAFCERAHVHPRPGTRFPHMTGPGVQDPSLLLKVMFFFSVFIYLLYIQVLRIPFELLLAATVYSCSYQRTPFPGLVSSLLSRSITLLGNELKLIRWSSYLSQENQRERESEIKTMTR